MKLLFTNKEQEQQTQNELATELYALELDDAIRLANVSNTYGKKLIIVYPKENELFIDIDSEKAFVHFKDRFEHLRYGVDKWAKASFSTTPSKSGLPKRHVVVTVPDMVFSDWERIALQFALGSDFIREALSTFRGAYGNKNLSVFFEVDKTIC